MIKIKKVLKGNNKRILDCYDFLTFDNLDSAIRYLWVMLELPYKAGVYYISCDYSDIKNECIPNVGDIKKFANINIRFVTVFKGENMKTVYEFYDYYYFKKNVYSVSAAILISDTNNSLPTLEGKLLKIV